MEERGSISILRRLVYASAGFTLVGIELPINVIIPEFYTDIVGVDVSTVATALLIARIFDAANDPLLGMLSDATRTRWGRRRPWIIGASLPLAACATLLFAPPRFVHGAAAGAFFVAMLLVVDLCWTAVTIPYDALGIEATYSYDERTRVLGLRDGLALLGTAAAVALPLLIVHVLGLPATPDGERTKLAVYIALVAPLIVVTCVGAALSFRERPAPTAARADAVPWRARAKAMLANRAFVVFFASFTVGGIATQLPVTLHLFYTRYVMHALHPDTYLPIFIAAAIVALPVWLWAAQRLEKRTVWILALVWSGLAQAAPFFVVGPLAFGITTALGGVPFGALIALPSSMQGDVIDHGAVLSGGRRDEGMYIGVWSVVRKLSGAAGVAVALWILGRLGYVANAEQRPAVLDALRVLYTLVPAVLSLIAALVCTRYPLDRTTHARLVGSVTS